MRALAGAGAQPLRHLDFLIHQPERSVTLYDGGVPVTLPRAERFAVHKLIVAVERKDQIKSGKDIMQADTLIEALSRKPPLSWRRLGRPPGIPEQSGAKSWKLDVNGCPMRAEAFLIMCLSGQNKAANAASASVQGRAAWYLLAASPVSFSAYPDSVRWKGTIPDPLDPFGVIPEMPKALSGIFRSFKDPG
jgi:hypothetical protein